jgi:2-(1,2-epoxy-1,2-dihydrophenyl)acetyl-CoA isomerase
MDYSTLLFDVTDNVATITLNRPEAANAMSGDTARELSDAALRCDTDPDIRAVLITGAGKMFCPGGDLNVFRAHQDHLHTYVKEMATYLHTGISRLRRMDAPIVAAVNGVAAGAGMSLALACDIVLAGESTRFMMAYTRAGLTPDGSATYSLPRIVGLKRAVELTLTNRMLTAQEALDWGIVARVVPDDMLLDEARKLAGQLAAGPTAAFGTAKRLLQDGWTETLETQMEMEGRAISDSARTADALEGITAFLEKRKPRFKGA